MGVTEADTRSLDHSSSAERMIFKGCSEGR